MEKQRILLLGSGGRESALAWKIAKSPFTEIIFIAPGNGGTETSGKNVSISPTDFPAIAEFAEKEKISLIVVGNEDPLVAGIYDYFREKNPGILVLGPSKEGARLEGSKEYAKQFMIENGIPTARYRSFNAETLGDGEKFLGSLNPPYVLKADGLAAGKGVVIPFTLDEAKAELREMLGGKFGASSATVVIEEFLSGIECSVFVLTDGNGGYRILPVAKDYKRVGEGDTGLNTGGMGAVSPVKFADKKFMDKVEDRIIRPTIDGLLKRGITYRGFIFLGLINVGGEPYVIEYNVRMGDPETEVVMLRIESDLVPLAVAAAEGNLGDMPLEISDEAAVTVIAVSEGYPGSYAKGKIISGIENVTESVLFHAGTKSADGQLVTNGGRVIAVSSMAPTVEEALAKSYRSIEQFTFNGKSYRKDIGQDLLKL